MASCFDLAFGPVLKPDFIYLHIGGAAWRGSDIAGDRERISAPCPCEQVGWRAFGQGTAAAATTSIHTRRTAFGASPADPAFKG